MIAPTAQVDERAHVAESALIWDLAQVREDATIGENCIIGRGAYIDSGVMVGDNCKIQNNALVYAPAVIKDGVFIGPAAVLTNDPMPRAVMADGKIKRSADWESLGVTVSQGASIGALSVILGGVEIGKWALIGAGSVVTKNVPAHALIVGTPGRRVGWVGISGVSLREEDSFFVDPESGNRYLERNGMLSEV